MTAYGLRNSATTTSKATLTVSDYSLQCHHDSLSFKQRITRNALHFATNALRFEGFGSYWNSLTMMVRMIQNYLVFLMPSCSAIWKDDAGSDLVRTIATVVRLDVDSTVFDGHCRMDVLLSLLVFIGFCEFIWLIARDPTQMSTSNAAVYGFLLMFNVFVPIGSIGVASVGGGVFGDVVFRGGSLNDNLIGMFLVTVAIVLVTLLRYAGFVLVHSCATVDVGAWLRPWGMNVMIYAHIETYWFVLTFMERFLDLNDEGKRVWFMLLCIVIANPIVAGLMLHKPLFQDVANAPEFAVQFAVGFCAMLLLSVKMWIVEISNGAALGILVVCCVWIYLLFRHIVRRKIFKCKSAIYSVYSRTSSCLSRPLNSWNVSEPAIVLSTEAYRIVEALGSLQIKSAAEYRYYLAVGTFANMPAIKNTDFIKWGMHKYTDKDTLMMCQQICQFFGADLQTQHVLIQKVHEVQGSSLCTLAMLHCIELHYGDRIMDNPMLLKILLAKAKSSFERSRRSLSKFWGCVSKRSTAFMEAALCQVRDSTNDANVHFDELMRCYPMAVASVTLNLSFMTELKGRYLECNEYMTNTVNRFADKYTTQDGISLCDKAPAAFSDPTAVFAMQTHNIAKYMEQERLARGSVRKMPGVIWALTIMAGVSVFGWLALSVVIIEQSFAQHPGLVDIILSGNTVIISMIKLWLGSKRLCFYGLGTSDLSVNYPGCRIPPTVNHATIVPYMNGVAEDLSAQSLQFFRNASKYNLTSKALIDNTVGLAGYGNKLYRTEGLAFALDLLAVVTRNVATNTPSTIMADRHDTSYAAKILNGRTYTEESHTAIDYEDVCFSRDMAVIMENMNSLATAAGMFGDSFRLAGKQISDDLNLFLYFTTSYLPAVIIGLSVTFLAVTVVCVHRENKFRLTLFLALPDIVATDFCKASRSGDAVGKNNQTSCVTEELTTDVIDQVIVSPEMQLWEAKKRVAEGLYHFTGDKSIVSSVGIRQYIVWYLIYVVVAVSTFYYLGQYVIDVDTKLLTCSAKICYSMNRLLWAELCRICVDDVFMAAVNEDALLSRSLWELSGAYGSRFLESSRPLHRSLIYGDEAITFSFMESQSVTDLVLKPVSGELPSTFEEQRKSSGILQHDGYRHSGSDLHVELFYLSTRSIINAVAAEVSISGNTDTSKMSPSYNLSNEIWLEYEHLNGAHILTDMNGVTLAYCEDAYEVIEEVMALTFVVSLMCGCLLLILIVGPMRVLSHAIYNYFDTMLHVLLQVDPDIFRHSIYIKKWLKGQVSRSNYEQYHAIFSREVPAEIQKGAVSESPEQILVFDRKGQYVNSSSYDDSLIDDLKRNTFINVMGLAIDIKTDVKLVEELDKVMGRFRGAHDELGNVILYAPGAKGGVVRLTVTGITFDEWTDNNVVDHHYYEYVAVLIRDVTSELAENAKLLRHKEKNIRIMEQYVPAQVAASLHDGNHAFKCVGEIVSFCAIEFVDYDQTFHNIDPIVFSAHINTFRKEVTAILAEFSTISLISMTGGNMTLAAGIFNDESTGQTESIEMIKFCTEVEQLWKNIETELHVSSRRKYAICTGGPLTYKLLMDTVPQSLVYGTIVSMTKALLAASTGFTIDQTTYHCAAELELEAQLLSDLRFGDDTIQRFHVCMDDCPTVVQEEESIDTSR